MIKLGPKMISGIRSVSGGVSFLHPKAVAEVSVDVSGEAWEIRLVTHAGHVFRGNRVYTHRGQAETEAEFVRAFVTEALEKCDKQRLPTASPVRMVTPWGWKIEAWGTHLRVTRPDGTVSEWPDAPTTNGSGMYAMCQDILKYHTAPSASRCAS